MQVSTCQADHMNQLKKGDIQQRPAIVNAGCSDMLIFNSNIVIVGMGRRKDGT